MYLLKVRKYFRTFESTIKELYFYDTVVSYIIVRDLYTLPTVYTYEYVYVHTYRYEGKL